MAGGRLLAASVGVEEVKDLVRVRDVDRLAAVLEWIRAEKAPAEAIRAWVLKDRRFFDVLGAREIEEAREGGHDQWYSCGVTEWMRVMCLIALCPPVEAARAIRWGKIIDRRPEVWEPSALLVEAQPRAWVETFTSVTSGIRVPERGGLSELMFLVRRGLDAYDLPCPDGATFVEYHLGPEWDPKAMRGVLDPDRVRADRFVPDIVYRKIRLGFAAQLQDLEESLPGLLADGTLERAALIESCLESLTVATRPGSQRSVVKLVSRISLATEEIAGGLPYITGVMATRDGMVAAYLLPHAITLLEAPSDLDELARVIASRKERKQKQVLLKALRTPELQRRVGLEAVREAVDILAAGQEDSSFLSAIDKVRRDLGFDAGLESQPLPQPLGLWIVPTNLSPTRDWGRSGTYHNWRNYLLRASYEYPELFECVSDGFFGDIVREGPAPFVAQCVQMRRDGHLAINRLVRLLESGFLAGGLSVLWPAALMIAEDAATAGKTLAGMPDLLRLLARYAHEVPDGCALPPHLAALAAAPGGTKAQMEARTLGAALARVPVNNFVAQAAGVSDPRRLRGLWDVRARPEDCSWIDQYLLFGSSIAPARWEFLMYRFVGNNGGPDWGRSQILALSSTYPAAIDPRATLAPTLSCMDQGYLPLAALVVSLGYVFERGALRAMWPLSVEIAAAVCDRPRKPNGLAHLLNTLSGYAHEVPAEHRSVPGPIAALAAERGSSKSHEAARKLVQALQATEAPAMASA